MQLHLDSASVESCVVFMPGNNRQRVARPFGRRFVNSEVTHAFTIGKLSKILGRSPPGKIQSGNTRREQCIGTHYLSLPRSSGARPPPRRDLRCPAELPLCVALIRGGSISRVPPPTVFLLLRSKPAQWTFSKARPRAPEACGHIAREPATAARVILRSHGGVEPPLALSDYRSSRNLRHFRKANLNKRHTSARAAVGQQWRRKPLKVKLLRRGNKRLQHVIDYVSK